MRTVLLLLLVLLVTAVILAATFVLLIRSWRKESGRFVADLRAEAAASGERILAGPEKAVYRGGTGPYGAVKGNGTIVLTDRRLVFRKLTGGLVEVPTNMITGTRQSRGFRGSRVGGMTHLVVDTAHRAEVAFFVQDLPAWERALGSCRPR